MTDDLKEVVDALGKMLRVAGIRGDEPMWNEANYQWARKVYEKWRYLEAK